MGQHKLDYGAAAGQAKVLIEADFDFLSAEYRQLFAVSDATAFQHPLWLDNFYRTMTAPYGAEKLVVAGRDAGDGSLLFVLPLVRRRRGGVVLIEATHLGVGDYAHPVTLLGWTPDRRTLDTVASVLPAHDVINIRPVRADAAAKWLAFLPGVSRPMDYSAHAVDVSAPFEVWRRNALETGFAKDLDRKKRKFLKAGKMQLSLVEQSADFMHAIETIAKVRAGRFGEDILQKGFARDFYASVARAGAAEDFARTYRLTLDGVDVALAFGLTMRGRFYYLLIGADYPNFGKYSPGLLLYDLMIEQWIADGGTVFDFTIGDEAFKMNFGTTPTPMVALVHTATVKGKLAVAAFDSLRDLQKKWKPGGTAGPAAFQSLRSVGGAVRRNLVKAGALLLVAMVPAVLDCVTCI